MGRFGQLLVELRRRRVFRMLVGWGITAFAILQVIEPILHAFHLPEWALTVAVIALALGFPVAAALAWVFDFTASGVTLTPSLAAQPGTGPDPGAGKVVLSRRGVALLVLGILGAGAAGLWFVHRESRVRWALAEALPRIVDLAERGRYPAAVALAEEIEKVLPDNQTLKKLWPEMSRRYDLETVPEGADVSVRPYDGPETAWRSLGRSPLRAVRLPVTLHVWRVEKAGFATVEAVPRLFGPAGATSDPVRFVLDPAGSFPEEMVHVPGGSASPEIPGLDHLPAVRLGDFLIDRTEVTNGAFKGFVDAGGYRRPEYWKHPFVRDGRTLPFEAAMALFRDRTGRPGPATWESGDHPDGQGLLPVTGVSWYEAEAYAAFAGKALPNLYQWSLASGAWATSQIVPRSNFGGKALAPVATSEGLGPYGTRDMAGNAKEWCWNASGDRRYILGGAWNEPSYMFNDADAQSPFSRAPSYGFRLVRALDDATAPEASAPITWALRDYRREKPVGAEVFQTFRSIYAYDRGPLDAKTEATDEGEGAWRKEKVSFAAAYGGERVQAYVFTPRDVSPPYQTVVFFPGSNAIHQRSSEVLPGMRIVRPVVRSGRALVFPIYKSTFERGDDLHSDYPAPTAFYRDHVVMWAKDLGRTLDYVASREDLDAGKVALYGVSWGAMLAPLLAALDERIRVGVLVGGGLGLQQVKREADPFHFAPHVRQPMLMVNGRYDFFFPYDTTQLPLFQGLGTRAADKRHVVFEAGHVPPNDLLTKEVLDWLDRYLGPVR